MSLCPQPIEHDDENKDRTYHLWNIAELRLVLSLDTIVNMGYFSYYYPLPGWSPDGSQFALGGLTGMMKMKNTNLNCL